MTQFTLDGRVSRPEYACDPTALPKTYSATARVLGYLLRATMLRVRSDGEGGIGRDRFNNRARELSDAMYPLIVAERNLAGAYRALCQRFNIDPTGGDYGPVEAWLTEGHLRWDRAIATLDARIVRMVVHDCSDLLATFATAPPSELDDVTFEGLAIAGEAAEHYVPTLPGKGLLTTRAWRTVWTLLSPLAHGHDQKYGNVVMFRRQREIDPRTGLAGDVPFMAGNAVRGLWRDLVMGRFLSLVGLKAEELHPSRAHALLAGGNVEAGVDNSGVLNTVRRRARELCPPWDLLGGCLDQQVMAGRLRVHDATLVCRETAWHTREIVAPETPLDTFAASLPEASTLTTLRLGTRQRDRDLEGGDGIQMLWNTEAVQKGAQFVHSFAPFGIQGVSELTLACLADILGEFRESGGVGAANARGYGLIAFEAYRPGPNTPELPDPNIYISHVTQHRDAIRAWCLEGPTSAAKPKAEKAPRRGRGERPTLKADEPSESEQSEMF